jgi:DNA-directed RNA polymerase subunit RPC12/RpoP
MERKLDCLRCKAPMEVGQLADRIANCWTKGVPTQGILAGLRSIEPPIETETYRCTSCGYLESYAPA